MSASPNRINYSRLVTKSKECGLSFGINFKAFAAIKPRMKHLASGFISDERCPASIAQIVTLFVATPSENSFESSETFDNIDADKMTNYLPEWASGIASDFTPSRVLSISNIAKLINWEISDDPIGEMPKMQKVIELDIGRKIIRHLEALAERQANESEGVDNDVLCQCLFILASLLHYFPNAFRIEDELISALVSCHSTCGSILIKQQVADILQTLCDELFNSIMSVGCNQANQANVSNSKKYQSIITALSTISQFASS